MLNWSRFATAGKPAAFLRGFKAVYLGLLMNCFILGWVTSAMVRHHRGYCLARSSLKGACSRFRWAAIRFCITRLANPRHTALFICIFILVPFTGLYTFIGGLWGVLVTDLFQFALKMAMIVVLAWVAVARSAACPRCSLQLCTVDDTATRNAGQPNVDILSLLAGFPC